MQTLSNSGTQERKASANLASDKINKIKAVVEAHRDE